MAPRMSQVRHDCIEYCLQLVFDRTGGVRMTRTPGQLDPDERAMALTVKLPTSVFKRASFVARIEVAENEISIPPISVEALGGALRDQFGADVLLTVQQQEQP